MNPTPLQVAIHESGHAVAHMVLDDLLPLPGPRISSVSVVPGDGFLGIVIVDPRVPQSPAGALADTYVVEAVDHNQRIHALYDIIEALAGPTAELYNEDPLIPLLLMDRIIPQLLSDEAAEDSDCANIRKALEWLTDDNPQILLRRLWEITYGVVATEWVGLAQVARTLRDRRCMDGDEFEAEWRKVRQSAKTRSRREVRLGYPCSVWRATLALARIQNLEPRQLELT